jgi:hypothetical protein
LLDNPAKTRVQHRWLAKRMREPILTAHRKVRNRRLGKVLASVGHVLERIRAFAVSERAHVAHEEAEGRERKRGADRERD